MSLPRPPIELGPLVVYFLPDGDDPGVGIVVTRFRSGARAETPNGVTVTEWNDAVKAFGVTVTEWNDALKAFDIERRRKR